MNDRFKFRLFNSLDNTYCVGVLLIGDGNMMHEAVSNENWNNTGSFIIEQCTGLKDKNGNLIYEGDKVEITIFGSIGANGGYVDSDEIYKGTVLWDKDCFLVKTDTDTLLLPHNEDCIEIIGNIHENKGE